MLSLFKQRSLSPGRPDRERLQAALAARDDAQRVLDEERSTFDRLQAVIDQADAAARAASNATRAANDARQRWVKSGCLASAREHQVLVDAATEAAGVAKSTAADADAAGKHLARAQDTLQLAQADLRFAEADITTAIGVIVAEEAAPLLRRLERIAEQYRTLRVEVKALERVLDPPIYTDAAAKSQAGARAVEIALMRATIRTWDQERDDADARDFVEAERGRDAAMIEKLAAPWRERAKALRENPDA